jgi:hypothetical protein
MVTRILHPFRSHEPNGELCGLVWLLLEALIPLITAIVLVAAVAMTISGVADMTSKQLLIRLIRCRVCLVGVGPSRKPGENGHLIRIAQTLLNEIIAEVRDEMAERVVEAAND